jgi:hypothetical protein
MLRIDVQPDPVTRDAAYDIVSVEGCQPTTLPGTSALCFVAGTGNVTVRFQLQYRPVLSVTFQGTVNGPLSGLGVSSQGAGPGFACDGTNPGQPSRCAQHYQWNTTVRLSASQSTPEATFLGMSDPCQDQPTCEFTILADTCITVRYTHPKPNFPVVTLDGPPCVTGGGGGGGGGSSTTVPTGPGPTTTTLPPDTQHLLDELLNEIINSLPLLIPGRIGPFTVPGRGTISATVTTSSATQARAKGNPSLLVKGKRRVRKAGDATLKLKFTKAGRKLLGQGAPVPVTITVAFKTKAGKAELSAERTIPPATGG